MIQNIHSYFAFSSSWLFSSALAFFPSRINIFHFPLVFLVWVSLYVYQFILCFSLYSPILCLISTHVAQHLAILFCSAKETFLGLTILSYLFPRCEPLDAKKEFLWTDIFITLVQGWEIENVCSFFHVIGVYVAHYHLLILVARWSCLNVHRGPSGKHDLL